MFVKLYKTVSPAESLTKDLTFIKEYNANLYNNANELNMVIKAENRTTANYASVEGYGLYFITNQISANGYCLYELTKDCLTTNRNEILKTQQLVSRSASKYNASIPDNLQPIESRKYVTAKHYATPLAKNTNGHNFLLGVIS